MNQQNLPFLGGFYPWPRCVRDNIKTFDGFLMYPKCSMVLSWSTMISIILSAFFIMTHQFHPSIFHGYRRIHEDTSVPSWLFAGFSHTFFRSQDEPVRGPLDTSDFEFERRKINIRALREVGRVGSPKNPWGLQVVYPPVLSNVAMKDSPMMIFLETSIYIFYMWFPS